MAVRRWAGMDLAANSCGSGALVKCRTLKSTWALIFHMNMLFRVQMQFYLLFLMHLFDISIVLLVQFRRRTRMWCVVPPRPWRRSTGNGVTVKHSQKRCVMWYISDTVYCVVLLCHTKRTQNSDGQIESLWYSVMFWWFCHILSLHAIVLVDLMGAPLVYIGREAAGRLGRLQWGSKGPGGSKGGAMVPIYAHMAPYGTNKSYPLVMSK